MKNRVIEIDDNTEIYFKPTGVVKKIIDFLKKEI